MYLINIQFFNFSKPSNGEAPMLGLPVIDVIVLGLYLACITALGIWWMKSVKSIGDFIMPRRFGKLTMMMHGFGTGTHSDQAVSVASKTYTNGLSGIWFQRHLAQTLCPPGRV